MQSRKLALGAIVTLALGLLAWWMLRDRAPSEDVESTVAEVSTERPSRVARKMASRADLPDFDPVAVVGVVRDTEKKPIAGAVVLLTPKSFESRMGQPGERPQPVHVRTDAGGGFAIEDVPVGRYTVSASARGYLTASHLAVRVGPGKAPPSLELILSAGGHRLTGTVEDVSGGPVEGALVSVIRHDGQNLLRQTFAPSAAPTDEDGAFALTLPSGTYSATVTHPDYVMAMKTFEMADADRTLDVRLTPGAIIEGVVKVRGSKEPVADAIVVASPPQASAQAGSFSVRGFGEHRVVADTRGRFRLSGLPSGVLSLNAVASGHASAEVTDVSVGIAETASDVVVWVEPAFSISGFVVPRGEDSEEGIEGVWVGALSLQPPGLFVARQPSEADGFFEIPGVQPGNYMVAALGEDHLPNLTGTSATVEDEDVTGVLVEMASGVTVAGRVDPPGPATVSLRVKSEGMGLSGVLSGVANAFVRTRTDEQGRFELRPVAAGELEVVAEADDGSYGSVAVDVGEDGERDVVIELEPRVSMEGTVVSARGEPVSDVKVKVTRIDQSPAPFNMSFSVNDNPLFGGGAPTGEDGTFVARGLEAGEYEVSVSPTKGPALKFADGGDADEPRRFTVPDGGLTGVRLTVEARDGRISGAVVDEDGAAVADAWVTVSLEGGGEAWMKEIVRARSPRRGREVEARMQDEQDGPVPAGGGALAGFAAEPPVLTDAAGRFVVEGLREGSYRVTAEASGGGMRVSESAVPLGADVTLEVKSLASLEGRLEDGGAPVKSYTLELQGPNGTFETGEQRQGRVLRAGLGPRSVRRPCTCRCRCREGRGRRRGWVTTDVKLSLESFGTLTGTVTNTAGEPVRGLVVMVQPKDGVADVGAGCRCSWAEALAPIDGARSRSATWRPARGA